jgi:hypothetical protein
VSLPRSPTISYKTESPIVASRVNMFSQWLISLPKLAIVLAAILIWQFVATLLMRPLGIRLPFHPFGKNRRRALQLLTFSQSVWEGVLVYGCGMFIGMTLFEYLACNGDAPWAELSLRIRLNAVLWPAAGLFVGAIHASENRTHGSAGAPPATEKHE